MTNEKTIHENVSEAYSKAALKPAPCECAGPVQKGTLAKAACYSSRELSGLPEDSVVNSFGCGNPLAFSDVAAGDVVLDLGAGAGIDVLLAAARVGPTGRVIGVDMTDEMVARAQNNIEDAGATNAEIRKGLIEELPVESASVDWVISNCVINLSPRKDLVFAEIARVLKPGGRFLVSDVIAEDLPEQVQRDLNMYFCCVAGAISETAFRELLTNVGMVDFEVRERIEYSREQLAALIKSDTDVSVDIIAKTSINTESFASQVDLAEACLGKVWSAKLTARKPL